MARSFTAASSHYLQRSSAVVSGVPLTMACWFNSSSATLAQFLMSIGASASEDYFTLVARGDTGGDPMGAAVRSVATSAVANSTTGYSTGVWHHAAAVFTSSTSRAAFLDGGSKGTDATNLTPSGMALTGVGRLSRLTPTGYTSGMIAEAAIWSAALTDAEVASLARGVCPTQIRPASLAAYWPLYGRTDPEPDPWRALGLTVTGATAADHPRVFHPRPRRSVFVPAAAGGLAIPVAMYHYRHRIGA